jgi:LPS export ABC transporter protein LptC
MTPWQRRLRAAIAVFGVGFAILIYFAIRHPSPPAERPRPVEREDPSAAMESTGCEILQLRGTKEDFRVECERSLSYEGGRQRLAGVRIFVTQRQSRDFRITSREAEIGDNQQQINLKGDVEMTTSDGLVVRAPEASYNQGEGILRASGAVSFVRGRQSGTAVGMTYEKDRNLLWLLDQAVLKMEGAAPGDPPVDITAGAAGFARPDHYVRFERGFRLVNGARVLESDEATAYLTEDESHVQMLEMRGHSRVSGMGDTAGALRGMTSQDMNLEFAQDGRTLVAATLSRDASIEVAGTGADSRKIAGNWMDAQMAPDGTTVTSLLARENVSLELPKDADNPARTITALELVARGEEGQGLRTAGFTDNVRFTEVRTGAAGAAPVTRTARSKTLDLAVQPGFGAVDEAKFTGSVRFEEGTIQAAAATARYVVKGSVLELEGRDETTDQLPQVSDERIAIVAQKLTVTLEGRKIEASGDVRSTMRALVAPAPGAAADEKRPSMLKADQPVQATASTLSYDGSKKQATYTTGARLWQGDTAIQGDAITIDDGTGNLTATGKARSVFMLSQEKDASGKETRTPTISSASELKYEEAARRAAYTTDAHVAGPQGDLRAGKVELYLAASGTDLDRVEGYGTVTLQLDARQATGDRLTYFTADQRYLMSGSPVRLTAQCRDTVGRALTFFRSNDTIIVDGNNVFRTFTRGGAKCEEPPKK